MTVIFTKYDKLYTNYDKRGGAMNVFLQAK